MTIVLEVNVGYDRETASLVAGFIQIAFWAGTFPPMWLIDRYGRRPMLLCGSIALTTTMVVFTISIALDTPATSKLALAMLLCYEISFGMSWNSIPWLLAPEITPLHLRHIGSAIGPFSEWMWTFVSLLRAQSANLLTGKGHSADHTHGDPQRWVEVLHPLLYHERALYSIYLDLSTRGIDPPIPPIKLVLMRYLRQMARL